MVDVGKAVGYLDLDASGFKKGFSSALDDLKIFDDRTASSSQKLAGLGSAMGSIGSNLTKSVTLPLVGVGSAAAVMATNFEQGVAKFGTLVDTNVLSVDSMRESVLALSAEVGISATDLTEALYQTLSATNDTANAMGYLESASMLAKGGFTDVTTAIDGVTSVMNAYGETGQEAFQKVADMMITTQNLGKTTVDELSKALFNVTPAAAAAGVSFDQVSAALAAMTAQGTPTSVATTQLRSAIQAFTKPSTEMIGAIKGVSNELIEQQKISGPLVEAYQAEQKVLSDLNEEYDKLDQSTKEGKAAAKGLESAMKEQVKEVDKAAAGLGKLIIESEGLDGAFKMASDAAGGNSATLATMMGSVEGLNAVLQLTSETGAQKYSSSLEGMQDSTGEAEKAFEAMAATTAESMEKLKATLEVVAIQIGDIILPVIMNVVNSISEGLKSFSQMDESTKKMIVTFAGIAAAIGPVLLIIGKVVTVISTISGAVASAGGAMSALSGAFAVLTGPIGLIIAGVAALVAAFATDFGGIRTAVMDVVNSIKETLTVWFGWLTSAWDSNLGGIRDIVGAIMGGIETSMAIPLEALRALFTGLFQLLRGDFDGFGETVNSFVSNMGNILLGFADSVLAVFGTSWENLAPSIKNAMDSAGKAVSNGIKSIGAFFTKTIPESFNNMINWFAELPSKVGESFNSFVDSASEFGDNIKTALEEKISGIVDSVVTWFNEMPNKVASSFSNFVKSASDFGAKLKEALSIKTKEAVDAVVTFFAELPYKIGYAIGTVVGEVTNAWNAVGEFFNTTVPATIDAIVQFFAELPGKIGEKLSEVITAAVEWGAEMISTGIETGEGFFSSVVEKIKDLAVELSASFGKMITDVVQWGSDMVKQGIETAMGFVSAVVEKVKSLPAEFVLWLSKIISDTAVWGKNLFSEGTRAITDFYFAIINKVKAIPGEFKKWLDEMVAKARAIPGQLYSIGSDIINNLWNGMKGVWDSVLGWFEGVLQSVKDFFRGIKDGMDDARRETANSGKVDRSSRSYSAAMSYNVEPRSASAYNAYSEPVAPLARGGAGDTYNFYSPVALTPTESARQMKKAKQEMALGFI